MVWMVTEMWKEILKHFHNNFKKIVELYIASLQGERATAASVESTAKYIILLSLLWPL